MSKIPHKIFLDEDAAKYGVDEAVFLFNIRHWIEKDKTNDSSYHKHKDADGIQRFWVFYSRKKLTELFVFWTEKQIRRIIKNLEKKKAILSGCFNRKKYDKTKWYTLNSDDSLCRCPKGPNPGPKGPEIPTSNAQMGQPIPNVIIPNLNHFSSSRTESDEIGEKRLREDEEFLESIKSNVNEPERNNKAAISMANEGASLVLVEQLRLIATECLQRWQVNAREDYLAKADNGIPLSPKEEAKVKAMIAVANNPKRSKNDVRSEEDKQYFMEEAAKAKVKIGAIEAWDDEELIKYSDWEYGIKRGQTETLEHLRQRCIDFVIADQY